MAAKQKKIAGLLCLLILTSIAAGAGLQGNLKVDSASAEAAQAVKDSSENTEAGQSKANTKSLNTSVKINEVKNVSSNSPQELKALSEMEKVAETEALILYVNKLTSEIAVKDKRDGYAWFSNPANRDDDQIASPLYKSELSAQVLVSYYNEKGQINTFNSFDDSVAKEQFKVDVSENQVKVVYQIGNVKQSVANIPKIISQERFQTEILDKLPDQETRESVEYKFRFDEEKKVYEVRKLQDYIAEEVSALFEEIGYTAEDAAADHQENGLADEAVVANAEFTIPLQYSLDGEHLIVTVPGQELEYNDAYPLASIQVLKFFGAADMTSEGYIFVPDGSGALIHLNSSKPSAEPYNLPVYGTDGTFDVKDIIQRNQITRLPVFGLKKNDHAMVGIIEGGDAVSSIRADVSGRNDSYNSVGSEFKITSMDFYTLSSGTKTSSVPMFQKNKFDGDLQIRYGFLSGKAADYTGMASHYRSYLAKKHNLQPLDETKNAPFILEVEGAFRKSKSFLGIPYNSTETLTTFNETVSLLDELKQAGVPNIDLRFVGWFNDGIRHSSPDDIKVVGALGGKKDLQELMDYTKQNDIGLYPDAAFLQKYKGDSGSAIFLDRAKAKVYNYNPVTYGKDLTSFSHYILSPAKLSKQIDGFMKDYSKLELSGLSLRDMGDEVNSDFNPDRPVTRQESLGVIQQEMEKLKKGAGSLMVNGGNAYSLPYANVIVNSPTRSSRMNLTDEDVPFYQIALHGYFDLAGAPFNMDEVHNPRLSLLKALETGSNIYYQWFHSPSSTVKDTEFDHLYALHYKDWFEEAVSQYNEVSEILNNVRTETIASHERPSPGVVQTTFENGTTITINYNDVAVSVNGVNMEPQSYQVGEGGE